MSVDYRDFDRAARIAAESPTERAHNTAVLREVIALHRPTWTRRGREYHSTEHDYVVRREHLAGSAAAEPFQLHDRFTLTLHGKTIERRLSWPEVEKIIEQKKGQH